MKRVCQTVYDTFENEKFNYRDFRSSFWDVIWSRTTMNIVGSYKCSYGINFDEDEYKCCVRMIYAVAWALNEYLCGKRLYYQNLEN